MEGDKRTPTTRPHWLNDLKRPDWNDWSGKLTWDDMMSLDRMTRENRSPLDCVHMASALDHLSAWLKRSADYGGIGYSRYSITCARCNGDVDPTGGSGSTGTVCHCDSPRVYLAICQHCGDVMSRCRCHTLKANPSEPLLEVLEKLRHHVDVLEGGIYGPGGIAFAMAQAHFEESSVKEVKEETKSDSQ